MEAARLEHEAYIAKLQSNGVEVHNVIDVLKKVDIEKIREKAFDVLKYDTSNIDDDPDVVEAYRQQILSKMTRSDLINCLLPRPTVILFRTGHNTGYEAMYTPQPLMNLYFTCDQGVSTPKGQIISRMNSTQRASETEIIELCYEQLGMNVVHRVTGDDAFLEGGDYIPFGTLAFIGCGMRTNQKAIEQLLEADVIGHDTLDRKSVV